MIDETLIAADNIVDLAQARKRRMPAMRTALCRHCGAALGEGEIEDECSGAGFSAILPASRLVGNQL